MAGPVNVTSLTTGVPIDCELIGTTHVQRVKLLGGDVGSQVPIPGNAAGLFVQFSAPPAVSISSMPPVTGTVTVQGSVSVSGPAQVSGTISVATMPAVSGTVAVSGSVPVSGTVSVSGTIAAAVNSIASLATIGTLLGTLLVSGTVVAAPSGTQGVSGTVSVSGTVVASIVPGVSVSVSNTSAVPIWVTGTVAAGAGTTVVSGTLSIIGLESTTAQPSTSATGIVVWQANPAVSVSVSVSISNINTVATLLGTVNVNVVAGGAGGGTVNVSAVTPVTTQASVSVTGLPVWFAPGALVSVSGTAVFSLVPGPSVTIQQGASVSLPAVSGVIASSVPATSNAFGMPVWIVGGQTTTGVPLKVTVTSTVIVSVVPGVSVSLPAVSGVVASSVAATSNAFGLPVWIVGGQTATGVPINVTVGSTALASIVPGASIASLGTVGTILGTAIVSVVPGASVSAVVSGTVTVNGNVTVASTVGTVLGTVLVSLATGGSVAALDVGRTNVVIVVTSTSVGISGGMMLFTVYQGMTQGPAGTSGYTVPAGKTFRVLAIQNLVQNSVTTSPVIHRLFVCPSTAAPTWTSTTPVAAAVAVGATSQGVNYSACGIAIADIPAGVTVGVGYTIGTSGGTIVQAVVNGYLFP